MLICMAVAVPGNAVEYFVSYYVTTNRKRDRTDHIPENRLNQWVEIDMLRHSATDRCLNAVMWLTSCFISLHPILIPSGTWKLLFSTDGSQSAYQILQDLASAVTTHSNDIRNGSGNVSAFEMCWKLDLPKANCRVEFGVRLARFVTSIGDWNYQSMET